MSKGYIDMSDPDYEDGVVLWLTKEEADTLLLALDAIILGYRPEKSENERLTSISTTLFEQTEPYRG